MNWIEKNNKLCKTFEFADFTEAMAWMAKAALSIEELNHHPEWCNVYNKVTVYLTTHDVGNTVTYKDKALADILDGI